MANEAHTTKTFARAHVNSICKVRLNARGLAAYEQQQIVLRARLPEAVRHRFALTPALDAEGYYRTTLWSLMERFGHLMEIGAVPPWDGDILIEDVRGRFDSEDGEGA